MDLKPATKERARDLGWSDDLIARLEESPARQDQVANLVGAKIAPDRVDGWLTFIKENPDNPFVQAPLSCITTNEERVPKIDVGENGLLLHDINVGSYGIVPEHWPYENDTPLGSHPIAGQYLPASYSIFDKSEVWADGVDVLYEDAIMDRWVPATDLDWENGLGDLPEEIERAVCQLATVYSNHGLIEQKIIAKWLEEISYGFHDVKLFLATQIYDAGRKVEALRKRALANGGGLGQAPLGQIYRGWYGALKFTEMIVALDVVYKSYEVSLFEAAEDFVQTDVERKMFDLMARDSRRHLQYGLRHLEWYLRYHGEHARDNVRFFLARSEAALATELMSSHPEREALVVLLAGSMETLSTGVEKLKTIREKQLQDYIVNLDSVGFDRLSSANPALVAMANDPLSEGTMPTSGIRR